MGNLSYRAGTEGKHTRKNLAKANAHTYRKTEQKYKKHGNEKIDTRMTDKNRDWTITGETIEKIVDDRIASHYKGKRNLRKDAVVVREIIVQASSELYEGLSIEEQQELSEQFTNDTYEFLCDEFGKDNVLGFSEHLDETNPHTHFSIMPLTDDGRLSQKDFFKGPAGLKRQHRQYREHMNDEGWDFDTENKFDEQEAVPLRKYKENAKAINALREENQRMLDEMKQDPNIEDKAIEAVMESVQESLRMQVLEDKEEELTGWFNVLSKYESELKEKDEALENRREAWEKKEEELENSSESLERRSEALDARESDLDAQKRRMELTEHNSKERLLEAESLNQKTNGNANFYKALSLSVLHGVPQWEKYRNTMHGLDFTNLVEHDQKWVEKVVGFGISHAHMRKNPLPDVKKVQKTVERPVVEDSGPDL